MEKIRAALAVLLSLCVLLGTAVCGAETYLYTDEDGQIADPTVYRGSWEEVYLQVLQARSGKIHAYQEKTIEFTQNGVDYAIPCYPAGLTDLTGDGIPELLVLEYVEDEMRGDLLVYSADKGEGGCILHVPGITWPEYDPLQGFEIWATAGESLLIRHDEMELEWKRQFGYSSGFGLYERRNTLMLEVELSGESEDRYYLNGARVGEDTYLAVEKELDRNRGQFISGYISEDMQSYGFQYTWEQAAAVLSSTERTGLEQPQADREDIYGLAIDRLATRKGPGTQYDGGGTYKVKGQYIKVLAKAWDGSIWWIKCEIPYKKETRVLWTGYKRFDPSSFSLDDLPEEE